MSKLLCWLAALALAAYVLLCILMYFMQDRLLFIRRPYDPEIAAELRRAYPSIQELKLLAPDGTTLSGWRLDRETRPGRAAPLILYFGGNAEEISWFIYEYAPRLPEYSLAALNYRGYGASGGEPSEVALKSDALFFAKSQARPGVPLIVLGRSLGTALALHVAAALDPEGLALLTPFTSILDVAKSHYPYLPVALFLRQKFLMLPDAAACRAPALFLLSEKDEIAPPGLGRALFTAYCGPKELVELAGADHNDPLDHEAYWQALRGYLASLSRN